MPSVSRILDELKKTKGTNAKKDILVRESSNSLLKNILKYALDPYIAFNVVKVPKVDIINRSARVNEEFEWAEFFRVADMCSNREITGNAAVAALLSVFQISTASNEAWMRKILKKNLAIGISAKSVNKVHKHFIPAFEIALAQKFEEKRIAEMDRVAIEPKLDGIRCFAIIKNGRATLYARSGKVLPNFGSTIGVELSGLPQGCYDGEVMGEDFTQLMRQAYRKENINLDNTYLSLFDYLPIEEWETKKCFTSCNDRYEQLVENVSRGNKKYLRVVDRDIISADVDSINAKHAQYASEGYEGAMVKDLSAVYKFGRGYEVMKLKVFNDVDLPIERCVEGTGRLEGMLGAIEVVYHGTIVQVGSGFSDADRKKIWADRDSFVGRVAEIRYQEITPDGSLRFPTFVNFRNDRE